jgi:hypothetical protein
MRRRSDPPRGRIRRGELLTSDLGPFADMPILTQSYWRRPAGGRRALARKVLES